MKVILYELLERHKNGKIYYFFGTMNDYRKWVKLIPSPEQSRSCYDRIHEGTDNSVHYSYYLMPYFTKDSK